MASENEENRLDITRKIIAKSFVSLPKVDDSELFDLLYCSRHSTSTSFIRVIASECTLSGNNIVLCGTPGVGKTSFIHYILMKEDLLNKNRLFPIMINCRQYEGDDEAVKLERLRNEIVDNLLQYFDKMKAPCTALKMKQSSDSYWRLVEAKNHLFNKITKEMQCNNYFPLIIIDDVDYMEEEVQHILLTILSDLISSDRASIIYACRKPAFREISYHLSDRPRYEFTKKAKIEELYPIEAQRVLARRMAMTLDNETSKGPIRRILRGFPFKKKDVFERYLKRYGYSLNSAMAIPYPFTDSQEYYMNELSNGDIRVIFQIAERLLSFILDAGNKDKWKRMEDETSYIGRENFIDILSNFEGRHYQNTELPIYYTEMWRLINLHEQKSYDIDKDKPALRGNSLLQNILELIVNDREICVGSHFWDILKNLGHKDSEIEFGVRFCLEATLIEPVVISTSGPTRTREDRKYAKHRLTKKGEFYIKELINWKEYITLFGKGGTSVYDLDNELGQSRLYSDILEMLSALIYLSSGKSAYLKIGKKPLYDLFIYKYGTGYAEPYDFSELRDRYTVTPRKFERELIKARNEGVASSYKQPGREYFAIKKKKTIDEANAKGIWQIGTTPSFPSHKFHKDEVRAFLAEHTEELTQL